MEDIEADGKNKSILTGSEYELVGPFPIHQVWQRLLQSTELQDIGDRPALLLPGRKPSTVTFAQLDQRATALARRLWANVQVDRSNRGPGDLIIAVCLPPSAELVVTLLAIFKIGGAYLPLDPAFPSNRVAHILDDAKPALLVTSTAVLGDVRFDQIVHDLAVFRYDNDDDIANSVSNGEVLPTAGQDLAVVLYTSGSTGTPKGVRLTHRNIYHRLSWQWRAFPFEANEVCCFKTALTFVDSIAEIWAPLLKAVPIIVVPKIVTQNPEAFIATMETYRVTRLVLVPSLLSAILAHVSGASNITPNRPLHHLRLWVCSGEVLTPQLLHLFFQHLDGKVCNFYGSTEVTGDVTCVTFRNKDDVDGMQMDNRVPLGSALDNCAIYILNSQGELVERGQIGEVFVSGAHVAGGYINGTKTSSVSFMSNSVEKRKGYEMMYRTGDYGRVVNDQLYYEGRADSQIKVRGHRIDLTEINAVLQQLDQGIKGVVLCYKPGQPEQEIIAFVVSSNPSSIHQSLKQKLMSYAMPRVVPVTEIPLLVNGKIDRQLLLRDYAKNFKSKASICRWNENELNRLGEKERDVASALLKTVLSVIGGSLHKPLSLTDNYFYVGGNSLNAVSVVTKLRDQGYYLELSDFLEADNFQQVLVKMEVSSKYRESAPACGNQQQQTPNVYDYKIEMLHTDVKEDVKRITCECFSQKGDLELLTGVTYEDYEPLIDDVWEHFLDANLSFTVKNNQGRIVACGMNCDAFNVPTINPRAKALDYVFEVLEHAKGPAREALVDGKKGHVLQNFLVVTDSALLTPAENVAFVQCVERETLALAKANGFQCIFTSNSSPLTQQICNDVLDYQILGEYQVNQFVASDGTRPFAHAPDSQLITIGVKHL